MKTYIGEVIEVYIPTIDKNGNAIDVMHSKKIGFKVMINNEIVDLILEQDDNNVNIFNGDIVLITEQVISNKKFVDIEIYEGDGNE